VKAWEVRSGMLALREVGSVEPSAIEGAMVVRVSHIGICGSDLPKLLHPNGFALPEPWRPGHEIVGTRQSGTAVVVDPLVPCGTCPHCSTGATHLCHDLRRLGWDLLGGLAEEVAVPAENARSMPDGLDPFHAVLADPAAVAIHGLRCNSLYGWYATRAPL
jgi:threonine dehydrogenase-like Zn-dependent dehydrogenase